MKTAGIIAEYNPFHNGHQYHIEETRKRTGADFTVAAISGDFVQRGAPAIFSKYDRARMALMSGADMVFELPLCAAVSSAEGFATGGVSLMSRLGVVDTLSCGCETANTEPELFEDVVSLLTDEPEKYKKSLRENLKAGMSYPAARQASVTACLDSGTKSLLSEPNNILAIEYARAIRRMGSDMELCLIPRKGGSHSSPVSERGYSSASAIRKSLLYVNREKDISSVSNGKHVSSDDGHSAPGINTDTKVTRILALSEPAALRKYILDNGLHRRCLCEDDFSDMLFYALMENKDTLTDFGPESPDMARRTAALLENYTTWSDFADRLKTRNQTYTAVSRYLTHILLGITRDDMSQAKEMSYAPCARLLGFKKEAAPLLSAIKKNADIPIIIQLADDVPALSAPALRQFQLTTHSADLYRQILQSHTACTMRSELRQGVITL